MKKRILSIILSLAIILSSVVCFSTVSYGATRAFNSGNLRCTLDTSTGVFTVSGTGAGADYGQSSNRAPWYTSYRDQIKSVIIEPGVTSIGSWWFNSCSNLDTVTFNGTSTVTKIGTGAFYNCTGSTYWLNIPESCTTIESNAFNNTNFNYVKFFSPKISIQTNSFGSTGYARFFGLPDSGARAFVQSGKAAGNNWFYYCLDDQHTMTTVTTEPTCFEDGYDTVYCMYCDKDAEKNNFVKSKGHVFSSMTPTSNGYYTYSCTKCGLQNLKVNAFELLAYFDEAISTQNGGLAFQDNYNAKYDLNYEGYINAKDFLKISKHASEISVANKQTTVNTAKTYQTMEGFGASGAWWAQEMGKWTDEQIDTVMELLYGETGAGLDIYRYNLGGGSNETDDSTITDWRRKAEDFLSSSSDINNASTYDWNADAAAQKVLASAQRANSDLKVTLFSNTPPVSITKNGLGRGNPATVENKLNMSTWKKEDYAIFYSNLDSSNYQKFANYVANCAEHFIDMGYNVTDVSPINEPGWDWGGGQEGCHYTADEARNFYNNYMIPTIKNRAKLNNKVGVSVWECEQLQIGTRVNNSEYYKKYLPTMFSNSSSYASGNANIRSYVDSFDTHSYWASTDERTATANDLKGSQYSSVKGVRCTEYCQMTNDGSNNTLGYLNHTDNKNDGNGLDIYFGLALADIIHQDLTILNAKEWDWWVACTEGVYPDGLVYYKFDDPSNLRTAKRLWVMGNYAKFIEEGATRVEVTTGSSFGKNLKTEKTYSTDKINYIEQTAYQNPDGSIVVVYINNSDTDEFTTFGTAYSTFESYVTDATRDLDKYQKGNAKNAVVHIPAKSVTTVVLNK